MYLKETPQFTFYEDCNGACLQRKEPKQWAKNFYDKMSRLEYLQEAQQV